MTSVMPHIPPEPDHYRMKVLAAVPLVLSSLVMAAHFYRSGDLALVVFALVAPLLVMTRELVYVRIVQLLLVAGAAEWLVTAHGIAQHRAASGGPVMRMYLILGGVALFTLLAAVPLRRLVRRVPGGETGFSPSEKARLTTV